MGWGGLGPQRVAKCLTGAGRSCLHYGDAERLSGAAAGGNVKVGDKRPRGEDGSSKEGETDSKSFDPRKLEACWTSGAFGHQSSCKKPEEFLLLVHLCLSFKPKGATSGLFSVLCLNTVTEHSVPAQQTRLFC